MQALSRTVTGGRSLVVQRAERGCRNAGIFSICEHCMSFLACMYVHAMMGQEALSRSFGIRWDA